MTEPDRPEADGADVAPVEAARLEAAPAEAAPFEAARLVAPDPVATSPANLNPANLDSTNLDPANPLAANPHAASFSPATADPLAPAPAAFDPGNWPDAGDPPRARRSWPVGIIALALAVLFAVAEVVGVLLANAGQFGIATIIGQSLIMLTVLSFLLGLFAVIRRRGRVWGAIAMVLSLFVNPLVLINLLALFGGV